MLRKNITFSSLLGLTLTEIRNKNDDELTFLTSEGRIFKMYHDQDCCESVSIEEIIGDLDDLLNSPILLAEEVSDADEEAKDRYDDSFTWTFYKLSTIKGSVTIRWYGTSNGYYSESVDFEELDYTKN